MTIQQTAIVAEVEMKDGQYLTILRKENGQYDAMMGDVVTQPNHDAEGMIRYLAHILQNYTLKS